MRAQVSLELVILISIAFAMTLMFTGILIYRHQSFSQQSEQLYLEDAVKSIHDELLLASVVSDGYQRSFSLPSKIGSKDYNVSVLNNSTILARTSSLEASRVSFTVLGQPVKGSNVIRRQNGIISLN